ncbi:uncharacterized protein [Amphiura filiformis]|uniref:uncharacterized protein n=1 Tax=Amphiura filiformis TaxID=82378 RepID=UPI003B214396
MLQPERHTYTLRQSKPLPRWLWLIIAKSLGIKTHEKDKPWLATIFYCLMLTCMLTYLTTTAWYVIYDIQALNTKYDVLNGTITLLMALGFSAISVYANRLAYKLFTNRIFLQSVRLHSKTVFSVNANVVLAVIGLMFMGLYSYQTYFNFEDDFCLKINLTPWICRFRWPSQFGLAITSFVFNFMVATVMLSVCRTHTISIRHFILILEEDSLVYEGKKSSKPTDVIDGAATAPASPDSTQILAQDLDNNDADLKNLEDQWDESEIQRRRRSVSGHFQSLYNNSLNTTPQVMVDMADGSRQPGGMNNTGAHEIVEPKFMQQHSQQTLAWLNASGYTLPVNRMLGNDEILDKFWKLQARLRTTSKILQRWISTWIVLILFWSTYYLLYWIDHDATILDMIIFFVPLVLLPVLCSGPTEVNGEGQRVSRSIVPTEERLRIIGFIKQSPLAITIYGFELNYSTIVTTMAAIALAFATKVIITNIQVSPDTTDVPPTVAAALTTPKI